MSANAIQFSLHATCVTYKLCDVFGSDLNSLEACNKNAIEKLKIMRVYILISILHGDCLAKIHISLHLTVFAALPSNLNRLRFPSSPEDTIHF